jgi:hypothetical protein
MKMATRAEKAFCVLEFARRQSIVTVQRRFRTKFGKDPAGEEQRKEMVRRRIISAISIIDREMLRLVWAEMDYRLDVCRVTKGEHIEHL